MIVFIADQGFRFWPMSARVMLAMRSVDLCLGAQRRRESTPANLAALVIEPVRHG
jgi:hypothetical protein